MNKLTLLKALLLILASFTCGAIYADEPADMPESESGFLKIALKPIQIDPEQSNKLDAQNRKHGLWVEKTDSTVTLSWYTKGLKNGLSRIYRHHNGRTYLWQVYNYSLGAPEAFWFIFNENGRVYHEIINIEPNREYTHISDSTGTTLKYQGYEYIFKPTGQLDRQGPVVFGENIANTCVSVGTSGDSIPERQ